MVLRFASSAAAFEINLPDEETRSQRAGGGRETWTRGGPEGAVIFTSSGRAGD